MKLAEQTINARHWIRIWEHTHITRYNTCPPTLSMFYILLCECAPRFESSDGRFIVCSANFIVGWIKQSFVAKITRLLLKENIHSFSGTRSLL